MAPARAPARGRSGRWAPRRQTGHPCRPGRRRRIGRRAGRRRRRRRHHRPRQYCWRQRAAAACAGSGHDGAPAVSPVRSGRCKWNRRREGFGAAVLRGQAGGLRRPATVQDLVDPARAAALGRRQDFPARALRPGALDRCGRLRGWPDRRQRRVGRLSRRASGELRDRQVLPPRGRLWRVPCQCRRQLPRAGRRGCRRRRCG